MNRRSLMTALTGITSVLLSGFSGRKSAAQSSARNAEREPRLDVSVALDSSTLLWVPFRARGLPAGLMHRPLRRLDDGSLRSAVVRIPAGWSSGGRNRLAERIQMYVIAGALRMGDRTLTKDTYLCNHSGRVMPVWGAVDETEVLLVCDGPPAFNSTDDPAQDMAILIEDVASGGYSRLWEDEESGATMSFLRVPPGWTSEGPEYHPCQEEIFCLTGDIAPDDIRVLKAGWFLWNPAYGVHGFHLHSTEGGTVLEWHDGPWAKLIYEG